MSRFSNPQLAHQWRQRLERFDQSELTIAEFCQIEGFSLTSFYHWRRKLDDNTFTDAPAFVPVDLPGRDGQCSKTARIEVQLPGGALIFLPGGTCPDDYRDLNAAVVDVTAKSDVTAKPDATHSGVDS